MNIDRAALQQFRDTWAPLIEGIPAVIDTFMRLEDLKHAVALKEKELTSIGEACTAAEAESQRRLKSVESQVDEAKNRLTAAKANILAEVDRKHREATEAIAQANQRVSDAQQRAQTAEAEASSAVASHQAVLAQIRQAEEAERRRVQADIVVLEERRAEIQQSIENLRQRILG